MSLARRISALVALAALFGGGLVAPVIHRAAHGIEHAHARHAAATQSDHVHSDDTSFTVSLEGLALSHEPCALCLPTEHWAAPLPIALPRHAADRSFAPLPPSAPARLSLSLLPIRGPPSVA